MMEKLPHERLLQLLSALLIEITTLQHMVQSQEQQKEQLIETVRDGLRDLEQMTREALTVVRGVAEEMPSAELEGVALPEAISRLVEEQAERLNISSRIAISGVDEQGQPHDPGRALSPVAERLLLLLTHEILYELEQRAHVRRLRLNITYGQNDLQLVIEDDGVIGSLLPMVPENTEERDLPAPPFQTPPPSLSAERTFSPIMQDLRRRFSQLGGSLDIHPLDERGRRIQAHLPYRKPAEQIIQAQPSSVPAAHIEAETAIATPPVRLLIVESQAVTRAGLRRLLETYTGLQVIGEAADGLQAASETVELGPHVVMMDAQLPEGQTLNTVRQIKQLNPDTRVLLLATQDREEYLYEALRAGADGYVLKDIAPDELAQAIHTVARGDMLIQPQVAGKLLARYGRQGRNGRYDTLTTREQEVLHLLARGLRNKEIAARLYVSERTINFHLANIYQKLNVSGRTEALSRALQQGLLA